MAERNLASIQIDMAGFADGKPFLCQRCGGHFNAAYAGGLCRGCLDEVEAQETAQERITQSLRGWTDVITKKPVEDEDVLLYWGEHLDYKIGYFVLDETDGERWFFWIGETTTEADVNPTHWRALPEPPQQTEGTSPDTTGTAQR